MRMCHFVQQELRFFATCPCQHRCCFKIVLLLFLMLPWSLNIPGTFSVMNNLSIIMPTGYISFSSFSERAARTTSREVFWNADNKFRLFRSLTMLVSPKTARWRHEEMRTCNFLLTSGVKELLIGAVDWFLCNILQAPMSGAVFSWRTCE